jgi:predicted nucleotidyltransferase
MVRDPIVERLRSKLAAAPGMDLAILFGSRARGEARAESDADVAVLSRGQDTIALAAELEHGGSVPVDVVDLEGAPYPLLLAVLRDGVPIFEREPGTYARFVSRSLAELETDLPNLRRMQRAFVERVAARGLFSTER